MVDVQFLGLLNATLQAATLLFIASLGELITEKSGILNLGVEGMISIGAVTGFMTAVNTNNIFLAIVVGILSSSIFASLHAIVTVILKQDQTVSGLILTILGLAVSSLLGKNYVGRKLETKIDSLFTIENPSNVLEVFLSQNIIFYLAIILQLQFLTYLRTQCLVQDFKLLEKTQKQLTQWGLMFQKHNLLLLVLVVLSLDYQEYI